MTDDTTRKRVITRFAPSPTGFLHIGGARTALFNWLFAKHAGGKMLLRIEDTDRAQSTQQAADAIIDGLTWLGLDWDGEPISQHSQIDRHKQVADQMIADGTAYRCFCAPKDIDAIRAKAQAEGLPFHHRCHCRDLNPIVKPPKDFKPVVRLKAPKDGETVISDMVKGRKTTPNMALNDIVLLRSDGTPTSMLAVVVNDHDMGVTHIIRGDDHQTNAAKQALIYQALGWCVPAMAHIPLIHERMGPNCPNDAEPLALRHIVPWGICLKQSETFSPVLDGVMATRKS